MLSRKIGKFYQLLSHSNFGRFLDILAWNLPYWLFHYGHNVLIHSENPRWKACDLSNFTAKFATLDDCPDLQESGSAKKDMCNRLKAGDRSYIVFKDDRLLSMVWVATGKIFIKFCGATFDTGHDGCFYYGSFTSEQARNLGLFSGIRNVIYTKLALEGRRKNWGIVSVNNASWLETVLKKNYIIAGETYYLKILFINICVYISWPYPVRRINIFIKNPPKLLRAV